ncbi:MAG TPA: hypothetical protein VFF70_14975 [Anaerolineae bacterium]|nr:hypothetical protein [Anaerolineae bacterium]
MEVAVILVGAVIAVFGAMMITLALWPSGSKSAPQPPIDTAAVAIASDATEVRTADDQSRLTGIQRAQARKSAEAAALAESVSLIERHEEVSRPNIPLQLETLEIISAQIERLQTEYLRVGEDRKRLAQELLTSWLIEKFDETPGRLKADTKKEAQDLRQQLIKTSGEFERVEFRLTSLVNLQARLDDPRVTQQIDDLVYAVKQLARER